MYEVISDKVHRLVVTLSYFRPDRFVQLLSLIPILILLFYLLVSIDLVNTGICEIRYQTETVLKENDCLLNCIHFVLLLKLL